MQQLFNEVLLPIILNLIKEIVSRNQFIGKRIGLFFGDKVYLFPLFAQI
ncbi:hypothetical protein SAMN06265379_1126 [Saccharicrinis carchari]|uniref:Uncharacterized protein n=1 Tax=Saccharicrinis carchari TaxID=1168039 RepID=A0A521EXZ1_SACCC|nr:hypothetical protein SAMN06265379_1126 [Saccharicrinis carchari]